jgi:hypothetical protein
VSDRGRLDVDRQGGPGAYRACLRSAIGACERCGAAGTALTLANRLRVLGLATEGEDAPFGSDRRARGGGAPASATTTTTTTTTTRAAAAWWPAPSAPVLLVDAPIGRGASRCMGLVSLADGGRTARSAVTPLAFDGALSLNRVTTETGRTHQIRVHMSAMLGAPLVGDRAYGASESRRQRRVGAMATSQPVRRAMLHAAELVLPHPTTGVALTLQCPPPPDFSALAGGVLVAAGRSEEPGKSGGADTGGAMSEVWASERSWLLGAHPRQ